jgi:hypothetical protein
VNIVATKAIVGGSLAGLGIARSRITPDVSNTYLVVLGCCRPLAGLTSILPIDHCRSELASAWGAHALLSHSQNGHGAPAVEANHLLAVLASSGVLIYHMRVCPTKATRSTSPDISILHCSSANRTVLSTWLLQGRTTCCPTGNVLPPVP